MSYDGWQQNDQENESGIDMHDCYHVCHPLDREYEHLVPFDKEFSAFVESHEKNLTERNAPSNQAAH